MLTDVRPGATVQCSDYPLGTVEKVLNDPATGSPSAIAVRHGRADYLLRVPVSLVADANADLVRLSIRLDEAETAAVAPEDVPPPDRAIQEGAATDKTPFSGAVLGNQPGVLKTDPQT